MECAVEGTGNSSRLEWKQPFLGKDYPNWKEGANQAKIWKKHVPGRETSAESQAKMESLYAEKVSKEKGWFKEIGRAILSRAMKDMVKGWCRLSCFPSRTILRKNYAKLKNHHWGGQQWGQGFLRRSFHSTSTLNTGPTLTSPPISLTAKRGGDGAAS